MPPTKWYINLPRTFGRKKKPRAGTAIKLTASATVELAFASNPTVDWTVDYGGDDGHEDYLPAGPSLDPTQSRRHHAKFVTTLTVPMVTGRTYTVTARRTGRDNQILNAQYQTWHRVYLTVHYMNQRCLDIYNAALPKIQAAFAAANIEIKQRTLARCRQDEPFSLSNEPTLPHLYRRNSHPLDRAPCHVRAVIVNDVASAKTLLTQFEIDRETTPNPDHLVRISSAGDNHERIVYENHTLVFDNPPFREGAMIIATTDPIEVPNNCISAAADNPLLIREIDVNLDETLALLELASRQREGRTYKVRITGRCRARRCQGRWGLTYRHTVDVKLTLANDADNPVVWYSHRVWIDNGTLFVERPQLVLDDPPVESITCTLEDEAIDLQPDAATRASDSKVSVALPQPALEALAVDEGTGTIGVKLVLLGAVASSPDIEDEDDHEFLVEDLTYVQSKRGGGVEAVFKYPNYNLQIAGTNLLFAKGSTPSLSVEITVGVEIPDGTWQVNDIRNKLEIDLSAHEDFAVAAEAMAAGRKVQFEAFLTGRESLGGYNYTEQTHFVALTTRRFRADWDDEIIERIVFLAFCHEIGHALGLTPSVFHNYSENLDEPHPNFYTDDHGGRGPHCHHNAVLVPSGAAHGRPDTRSGTIWHTPDDDSQKLCIMYHAIAHRHIGDTFCDDCLTHLERCTARFT